MPIDCINNWKQTQQSYQETANTEIVCSFKQLNFSFYSLKWKAFINYKNKLFESKITL